MRMTLGQVKKAELRLAMIRWVSGEERCWWWWEFSAISSVLVWLPSPLSGRNKWQNPLRFCFCLHNNESSRVCSLSILCRECITMAKRKLHSRRISAVIKHEQSHVRYQSLRIHYTGDEWCWAWVESYRIRGWKIADASRNWKIFYTFENIRLVSRASM